jgi:hypothetical protein
MGGRFSVSRLCKDFNIKSSCMSNCCSKNSDIESKNDENTHHKHHKHHKHKHKKTDVVLTDIAG